MKIKGFVRIIYGLVGLAGLYALYFMVSDLSGFWSKMDLVSGIGYILLEIGGLNWGIKSVFDKDLFEILRLV